MSITELAIKRPSIIVVIFSVFAFLGIFSYSKLNYELMPKFSIPIVTITTIYPGASPAEVENSVTKKIEDAISSVENLDDIKSTSREGVSSVVLQLKSDADPNLALQDAQRKVNAMLSDLPDDAKTPMLGKFSFDDAPIMRLGVTAKMPPTKLYAIIKDEVSPSLGRLEGAAKVSIVGGEEREIKVNIDRSKAESFGIGIMQVSQAIQSGNMDFPTGKVKGDNSQKLIRLKGKYKSLDEIRSLIISTDRQTGSPIRISDIATVSDATKEVKTYNRIDGKNSVGLLIQKQTDANAVALSKLVKTEIANIEKTYAKDDLHFVVASDTSDFTLEAANGVLDDLLLAIIIVSLCMLLFLHSLRNALIVMIAIPASLIAVFVAMLMLGYSLNLMTLLAISLVVGILVDDSIVVLENIYRHLEKGEPRIAASIKGRSEIGFTALGITLVDVVVFFPLTLVGGIISNILSQFSVVIVLATLMSLFVSFTVTPLLASRLAKVEHIKGDNLFSKFLLVFENALDKFTAAYLKVLRWALQHKRYVLPAIMALFFASFMLVSKGFIGSEFVSQGDRGEFIITLELPQDAKLAQNNDMVKRTENYLFGKKEVTSVISSVGTTSSQLSGSSSVTYKSELNVKLVPKDERKESSTVYAQIIKHDLEKMLPNVKVNSAVVSITGAANDAPIQLAVSSSSFDTAMVYAQKLEAVIKAIPGTAEAKVSVDDASPEVTVNIDRDKMAELGLSMNIVGANMQVAFNGNTDSKYNDKGKEYDINVIFDDFNRKNAEDVANLMFVNSRGESIKLSQFATITESTGPSQLERKNRIPTVTITSQVIGISSGTIMSQIDKYLLENPLPDGVFAAYEGNAKNQGEAFGNMGFALIASILFIYLIMVALYDSYVYPFVVLFSLPLAVIGALLALALSANTLSIFSMLGMIMLLGLVAKNAILIVDFTNQLKAHGHSTAEALIIAGKTRLRPILMTTLSMITGMMPIALSHGAGAEWKGGLGWVLIGGLTSSMFLTLVVVPCVFMVFDIFKREVKNSEAKTVLKTLDLNNLADVSEDII
ncbi:MAG TPA: efflux RND transporter permease subunit [Chitinophagales bacterium]